MVFAESVILLGIWFYMPASNLARVGLKSRDSTKYTAVTDPLAGVVQNCLLGLGVTTKLINLPT